MEAKWIVVFLISPFIGLLTLATVVKFIEVRRTNAWASSHGRIVRSQAVQRKVSKLEGSTTRSEIRNFAAIVYEFDAGGRKFTGSRVSLGEDLGNIGIQETLARYPVGERVEVYYDPADPAQAVLERTLPNGSFLFMGLLIAGLTLFAVVVAVGMDALAAWMRAALPNPAATPFVVAFTLFALILSMMARLASKESSRATSWPSTEGKVIEAGFDTFRTHSIVDSLPTRVIVHRPRILYAYKVGGNRYQGERISLGVYKHASLKFLVGSEVSRYRAGENVTVYYDPENPARAVLTRTDVRPPMLLALAALFAAAAIWVSVAV
ncbi:DUF3592 domain-containing protein [Hyphomicrobium sp. 1Nfss2.1]|uniref:DUF3592 domain-containing protein n=1 Tax=Hyphomicrobium sp. 1Nfss2.1 TaxID=3413936 RepID=UPI003C7A515A